MSAEDYDPKSPPTPGTPPRLRVLDLVRRLARVTVVGGAAAGLSACESCSPVVCDPLPPPIHCSDPTHDELLRSMDLSGRWVAAEGGGLEVSLNVNYFGRPAITFAPTVTLDGGTQKRLAVTATSVALNLAPAPGVTHVTVGLRFDCSGTQDALTLTLDVSGTPQAESAVPVTLTAP